MTPLCRHMFSTAAIWIVMSAVTLACPVCFRMEEGPVTDGVRAAVIVLMGVTTAVLGGFGVFIRGFVRRARSAEAGDR
jgi:hypothetical protein